MFFNSVVDGINPSVSPTNPFAPPPGEADFNPESSSHNSLAPPVSGKRRTSKQFFGSLLGSASNQTDSATSTPNSKRRGSAIVAAFNASSNTEHISNSPSSSVTPSVPNSGKRRGSVLTALANVFSPSANNENSGGSVENDRSYIDPGNPSLTKRGSHSSDSSTEAGGSHPKPANYRTSTSRVRGSSLGKNSITSESLQNQQQDPKVDSSLIIEETPESLTKTTSSPVLSSPNTSLGDLVPLKKHDAADSNSHLTNKNSEEQAKEPIDGEIKTGSKEQLASKSKENLLFALSSHGTGIVSPSFSRKSPTKGSSFKEILPSDIPSAAASSPLTKKSIFHKSTVKKKDTSFSSGASSSKLVSNTCPRCKLETDANDHVAIESLKFHTKCMTCATCNDLLSNEAYTWKEEIYCKSDFHLVAGLVCSVCDLQIQKEFINVGGKKFHPECKNCSLCRAAIIGKDFAVFGNSVFCHDHKDCIPCFSCHKKIEGALVEVRRGRFSYYCLCRNSLTLYCFASL